MSKNEDRLFGGPGRETQKLVTDGTDLGLEGPFPIGLIPKIKRGWILVFIKRCLYLPFLNVFESTGSTSRQFPRCNNFSFTVPSTR